MPLCHCVNVSLCSTHTLLFSSFWMMPALVLKKMVMGNFERGLVDADIADSIDFMVESVGV